MQCDMEPREIAKSVGNLICAERMRKEIPRIDIVEMSGLSKGVVERIEAGETLQWEESGTLLMDLLEIPEAERRKAIAGEYLGQETARWRTIGSWETNEKNFKGAWLRGDWPDTRLSSAGEPNSLEMKDPPEQLAEVVRKVRPCPCRICGLAYKTKQERYECCVQPIRQSRAEFAKYRANPATYMRAFLERGAGVTTIIAHIGCKQEKTVMGEFRRLSAEIREKNNIANNAEWREWKKQRRLENGGLS